MPELPEVETIRLQIAARVAGQRIIAVRVTRDRAVRAHATPHAFVARVEGRTILAAQRRGKVLLLPLDDGHSLLIRLGMSGKVVVVEPTEPLAPHTHVVLSLANGTELRYIDPRTFGQVAAVDGQNPADMIELAHYGPEPLEDGFTVEHLARCMAGKNSGVQAVLMDQTQVVGVGKIYADESCFLAGIHPERAAKSLTLEEMTRLHAAVRDVLQRAIASRGTSTLDAAYRDAHGQVGGFQCQLHVYQREHQPCRVCGTPVEYRPFQGRRMHFCPQCQR